jgi:YihY family inner membrane protein
MKAIQAYLRRFDRFQQSHRALSFPLAVVKKFGDDQAGYLAALVAYYAFFSLFPLLLVFTTILGFILKNSPALREKILSSVINNFPVLGQSISDNVHPLHGSGLGLVIGAVITLIAGIAVIQALQNAMDNVWGVPRSERPNFFVSRLRALIMLGILGVATLAATAVGAIAFPFGLLGSLVLNFGILIVAFKVLTVAKISWRNVVPGSFVGGIALTALQKLGSYYVQHALKGANATYGTFAVVIGLLSWLYLGAQITLYAAEINVVEAKRLWPRSFFGQEPTPGDEQALAQRAESEKRLPGQVVDVRFEAGDAPGTG